MELKKNPFYVLSIRTTDNRRTIARKAEEKSLLLDQNVCSEAQNTLLIPAKRVQAEIEWFVDTIDDAIDLIRVYISNNLPIPVEGLIGLSRFNAIRYNTTLSEISNQEALLNSVWSLNRAFSDIDIADIQDVINNSRKAGGFAEAALDDINVELGRVRQDTIRYIGDKLAAFGEEQYVALATQIGEKYVVESKERDCVLLSNILDEYEMHMNQSIEKKTEEIVSAVEEAKKLQDPTSISKARESIVALVKAWDTILQPLQLRSMVSGLQQANSTVVAGVMRGFAVFLNNERNLPDEALKLTEDLKDVFAELPELVELFSKDKEDLKDIIDNEKKSAEADEFLKLLEGYKKDAEQAIAKPNKENVDAVLTDLYKLSKLYPNIEIDEKTRENLYVIIIGTGRNITTSICKKDILNWKYAFDITKSLQSFPDDAARDSLNDKIMLLPFVLQEDARAFKSLEGKSNNRKMLRLVGGIALVVILALLVYGAIDSVRTTKRIEQTIKSDTTVNSSNNNSNANKTETNESMASPNYSGSVSNKQTPSTSSEPDNTKVSTSEKKNQNKSESNKNADSYFETISQDVESNNVINQLNSSDESKLAKLSKEIDDMKEEITSYENEVRQLDKKLSAYESQLDSLKSDAKNFEIEYNKRGSQEYLDQYNNAVDLYNGILAEYNPLLEEYQKKYKKYEEMIDDYNELVEQYNALVQ